MFKAARETVQAIIDDGGEAIFVPCDVRRADDARGMVAATVERFGRLDAAVNNAGIAGSFEAALARSG